MKAAPFLQLACFCMDSLLSVCYRIAQNFGGGKHWRIWRIIFPFGKVLPSKVLALIVSGAAAPSHKEEPGSSPLYAEG